MRGGIRVWGSSRQDEGGGSGFGAAAFGRVRGGGSGVSPFILTVILEGQKVS